MSNVRSLLTFAGTRIITLQAVTIPVLKSGNPFGGTTKTHNLRKYAEVQAAAGGDYEWLVNIARVLEGTPASVTGEVEQFVALPASWGTYMRRPDGSRLPIVEHTPATGSNKGQRTEYLPVQVQKSLGYEYRLVTPNPAFNPAVAEGPTNPRTVEVPVDAALVTPWLPSRNEGARQGVERKVIWRKYELANIARVSIGEEVGEGFKKAAWDAAKEGDALRVKEIIGTLLPAVAASLPDAKKVDG